MNKNLVWLTLPALLASCSLFGSNEPDSPEVVIIEEKVEISVNVDTLESGSDWGKDRSSITAKTVEWGDLSTSADASYLSGTLVIDQVHRHDADDFYGIRLRLGNRTTSNVNVDYLFRFYDTAGRALASLHEGYRSASIRPRGTAMIIDAARSRGAVGFRLFIRKKGTTNVGYPDADLVWINGPQNVTTWLNGIVFVDKVLQDNPSGTNRVMFRLGANSVEPVAIEYRITFYNDRGNTIRSDHDDFRPLTLAADAEASILNTCRKPGATGYRLFVRTADSEMDGLDDQSVPTNQ